MRERLGDRWRPRIVGAVDPRISGVVRQQSDTRIPLAVGTPLVWACADDYISPGYADGTLPNQGTFTDRMGISWSTTSGADPLRQLKNGINGRSVWVTGDKDASSTLNCIMESTAITTGANVTIFMVVRNMGHPTGTTVPLWKNVVSDGWSLQFNNPNVRFAYNTEIYLNSNFETGCAIVLCGRGSAAAAAMFVNGAVASGPTVPATADTAQSSKVFVGGIGLTPSSNYSWCMIGEWIVYDSFLSDANRNAVEKYLGRKYGLSVS